MPWLGHIFHAVHHQTDGLNLACAPFWPLNRSGRLTERVAAFIASALERATHFIDLHPNPELTMSFAIVNWDLCRDAIIRDEMARMPVDGYCWSFTGSVGSTYALAEGTSIAYVFRERGVQPRQAAAGAVARPLASADAG